MVTVRDASVSYTGCAYADGVIYFFDSINLYALSEALSALGNIDLGTSPASANSMILEFDDRVIALNGNGVKGAICIRWNGTTFEYGDDYKFNSTAGSNCPSGAMISNNQIVLAYADSWNSNYGTTTILTVEGNQIAGSFIDNSKDAIALASGESGDTIPVGFGGYCKCNGVTEGQQITSAGVSAFSPLDGWLMISYAQEKLYVVGKYVGTGTYGYNNQTSIDVGFSPSKVELYSISSTKIITAKVIFINYITSGQIEPLDGSSSESWINFTFTNTGIKYYGGSANYQCNSKSSTYYYIAWR